MKVVRSVCPVSGRPISMRVEPYKERKLEKVKKPAVDVRFALSDFFGTPYREAARRPGAVNL